MEYQMKNPTLYQVSEQVFYILLSLSTGPKHGYAILKDVETLSENELVLSTSTLYGALIRLEEQGIVRHVPVKGQVAPGLPRKVYELTPHGLVVLQAEVSRLERMAKLGKRHLVGESN
ncbi:MAG: PadR family transcriptional regulator [Chloroflexi bacterium]|nr:MAG: PadR family transcriptional regulator [Chloroflexota bacterium]